MRSLRQTIRKDGPLECPCLIVCFSFATASGGASLKTEAAEALVWTKTPSQGNLKLSAHPSHAEDERTTLYTCYHDEEIED